MTVSENAESIETLKERIHFLEKIMDLLHPIWRYENIEDIEAFTVEGSE